MFKFNLEIFTLLNIFAVGIPWKTMNEDLCDFVIFIDLIKVTSNVMRNEFTMLDGGSDSLPPKLFLRPFPNLDL